MSTFTIELIGYLASALVATAYFMTSTIKLRVFGMIGGFTFVVYGLLIHSIPIVLVNGLIAVTNIYFLFSLTTKQDLFELMEADLHNPLLHRFLRFYNHDIKEWFPDFDLAAVTSPKVAFVFRDLIPVGLLVCEPDDNQDLVIHLDYVIPNYRDFQNARFIFDRSHMFSRKTGAKRFLAKATSAKHRNYLEKVGFQPDGERGDNWFQSPVR